jgi:Uma2 family endonuclease
LKGGQSDLLAALRCFLIAATLEREDTRYMATQPISEQPLGRRLISVEEYLSTGYEPDCEYDDGVVVERNVGEFEHSFLQIFLGAIFTNNMGAWGVLPLTEQRVQIAARKFLIPDVCVLRLGDPTDDIVAHPPLIAIEIMSPEDTPRRTGNKATEYVQFGVEHVWVIDPKARAVYRGTVKGLEQVPSGELTVPGTPIVIRIAELFEKLDRVRATGSDELETLMPQPATPPKEYSSESTRAGAGHAG